MPLDHSLMKANFKIEPFGCSHLWRIILIYFYMKSHSWSWMGGNREGSEKLKGRNRAKIK